MGAVSCTLRHIADFFGPAFLTLFYFSTGLMMILTLMLFGVVVSNHRSTAEVSQCHVDLENSAVDLNEFYPSLDEPIKLPLLRYSYDWNGKGLEDSCAVVLEKCEICDCKENETALLVEARDWNVTCKILPKAALAVDRRNIGDKDDSQDEDQSSPIQPDNSELAGPLPSASPAGAYSALRAQENAAPAVNKGSAGTDRATTDDTDDDSNDDPINNSSAGDSTDRDDKSEPAKHVKGETDAEDQLKALHVYSNLKHLVGDDGEIGRSLGSKTSDKAEVTTLKDDTEDDKTDKDDRTEDSVGKDVTTTQVSAVKEETTSKDDSDRRGDINEESLPELSPKYEMEQDGEETRKFLGQLDSWRSKYFTVLGFFICFLIIFVIIVLVLVIKLKAARSEGILSMGNVSPGPGTDRCFNAETDPLTPSGATGSFKFNMSQHSLPR